MRSNQEKGFTLIELLFIIAILALVASAALAVPQFERSRSQLDTIQDDARGILAQIDAARTTDLTSLTGNWCTMCAFDNATSIDSQADALANLNRSWVKLGFASSPLDPWGRPFLIDENVGEFVGHPCRYDLVYSAGPNGIWEGWGSFDPNTVVPSKVGLSGSGDDYFFAIDLGTTCLTLN